MGLQYSIVGAEDGSSNITVFMPGRGPLVAHSSHPNYEAIEAGAKSRDESVADLFDVAETAATKFERLTERVTTANGRLYFDGVEVNDSLAKQVVRFIGEDVDDWKPLVRFLENVQQNPQDHSREQLYGWLDATNGFTITDSGLIVGYKGVRPDGDKFKSINTGRAIVDGEVYEGAIPNYKGAVVEMPRDEVTFDPALGCAKGLHVGTYEYASGFARGALLEVHVNPRDVVSIPTDSGEQKMRTCRYTVIDTIDKPYSEPLVTGYLDDDDLDADYWGDGEEDDDLDFDPFEYGESPVDLPEAEENKQTPTNGGYGVSVGEEFEDLDARRSRILKVVGFGEDTANNEVIVENTVTGKRSSINANRLLTPYRFLKI